MRKRILLLSSLPPLPARANGFSVRYAPILAELATTHDLDLALVQDVPRSSVDMALLERFFRKVAVYGRLHRKQSLIKRVTTRLVSLLPRTTPYPLVVYDADEIEAFLRREFGGLQYDVLLVTSPELTDQCLRAVRATRVVIDAIDSMTLLSQRSGYRTLINRYDGARVRFWERTLHHRADFVSYISQRDRAAVYGDTRIPVNVGVIPNGVYLEDDTTLESSLPALLAANGGDDASIVFLGNMGYAPNIDAALRLAALLPRVQARYPAATLSIVGRNPVPEIVALARQSGVRVTGEVPSIWPHLRNARVCCFPMAQGAGLQNKVLEALWSGRPVVTTPVGNSGVQGTHRQHLLVADHEDALVEALVFLLRNQEEATRLGQSGRAFVEQKFSWTKVLSAVRRGFLGPDDVETLLECAPFA